MKGTSVKTSDLKQAERILRLIRQLTAEELSSLEIISDNPDGPPDCAITRCEYLGANHPGTDDEGNLIETFHGETLLECLLKAMSSKGLDEDLDWSRDLDRLIDEANIDDSILESIATAAAKALAMFIRCRDAARGRFSGSATAGFIFGADEFELTIKPKRTGFAFVETDDTIENDRAGDPDVDLS